MADSADLLEIRITDTTRAKLAGGGSTLIALCARCGRAGTIDVMTIDDVAEDLAWVCASGSADACDEARVKGD